MQFDINIKEFDYKLFNLFADKSTARREMIKNLSLLEFTKNPKNRGVLLQKKIFELIPNTFSNEIPKAHKTFTRWIDDEEKNNYVYNFSDTDPKILSYLNKLQLIQNAIFINSPHRQKLTNLFVINAERIFYQINDPFGSKVDLLAQWVLIYELYLRDRIGITTNDIDDLITYSPWEDNAFLYSSAILSDLCSYPKISILINNIDDIAPEFLSEEFSEYHTSLVASAYAWLRIPLKRMYWDNKSTYPEVISNLDINFSQEFFNNLPTWRQLVQSVISGELSSIPITNNNLVDITTDDKEHKVSEHPDNIYSEPKRKLSQKEFQEIMRRTSTLNKEK